MDSDEAADLLLTSSIMEPSQENRSLVYPTVKELGYLALAVAQVGAYISHSCSLTEYLSIYNENRAEVLRKHAAQTADDYEWNITWEISLKKLSAAFLQFCAFLHYNGISEAIFQASSARDCGDMFSDATDFLRMFQTTERLSIPRSRHRAHILLPYKRRLKKQRVFDSTVGACLGSRSHEYNGTPRNT
jgi:hypothetical protein